MGMTCVPGGVFLMGATQYFSSGDDTDPTPERLVQLSPFAIDSDEVTVGKVQPLVQSGALPAPLSTDPDPQAVPPECTYGSGNALLPVTCVSWAQADEACRLLGKRLPKEAEWEYVAGNVGLRTPFPWGPDTNVCSNAVVARGRLAQGEPTECLSAQSNYSPGPLAGGATADATTLGVMNLGGNVNEWVADVFGAYSGPCWTGATLLVNPQCQAAVAGASAHTFRGGSWQTSAFTAYTYQRDYSRFAGDPAAVGTGFRCAVDM
jgi:formylglycine-generating enzyme